MRGNEYPCTADGPAYLSHSSGLGEKRDDLVTRHNEQARIGVAQAFFTEMDGSDAWPFRFDQLLPAPTANGLKYKIR